MTRAVALGLSAFALLALAVTVWGDGTAAARAWLFAVVLVSAVPIGSLAMLLVHGISGGRWGDDLAPVLVPAARAMPLVFLAFLPVIAFRPLIYQWSALSLPPGVLALYLNPLFFDARTLFGLAVWSALAWSNVWRHPLSAARGLVAHIILLSFLPADWILTIAPGSVSAGFGFGFGIEQMFAALGFAAVLAPQKPGRATRDLAGLLLTTLLGTVYFLYMQFVVTWYGNIPAKVHWFVVRTVDSWPLVAFAAFLIGAVLPLLAIFNPAVRREPYAMRVVGCFVLAGIALQIGWMALPAFGSAVIAPAIFAILLMALLCRALFALPRGAAYGH